MKVEVSIFHFVVVSFHLDMRICSLQNEDLKPEKNLTGREKNPPFKVACLRQQRLLFLGSIENWPAQI